jgi:hypothetical protein
MPVNGQGHEPALAEGLGAITATVKSSIAELKAKQ